MKIRSTISNDLDLDKCYPDHDAEHLRGFSHQLDTLDNANAGSAITQLVSSDQLNNSIPQVTGSSSDSSSNSAREEEPVLSSVPAAQAVNLLVSQLPIWTRRRVYKFVDGQDRTCQRFRREVPYQIIFQRVDNHKWNFTKESFQEYVMYKLKLMQNLRLSNKKSINFLISYNLKRAILIELPKIFCVYCRTKGHTRDDCFRLKKKKQYKSFQPASVSAV
ncbi:hypothetical protein ALC53_07193 [Atta colombica]|uniref:Uncharacterized protein n=1 Tax=Atta colombica TaxID=520822 RepID=A0A195BE08_9HYME|nr:hypothetical protein ALC53_07193 [Atta colombica]